MKLSRILPVLLVATGPLALAQDKLTVQALLLASDKLDGKVVVVVGKVKKFEQRTSKAGNDYYVFKLYGGKDEVNVYGHGTLKPPVKEGELVEVSGKWQKVKVVGGRTYKNEIGVLEGLKPASYVKPVLK